MASLADIVFDCAHPAWLARFWAAVLDHYVVAECTLTYEQPTAPTRSSDFGR